jgi:hypothetical protein
VNCRSHEEVDENRQRQDSVLRHPRFDSRTAFLVITEEELKCGFLTYLRREGNLEDQLPRGQMCLREPRVKTTPGDVLSAVLSTLTVPGHGYIHTGDQLCTPKNGLTFYRARSLTTFPSFNLVYFLLLIDLRACLGLQVSMRW